MATKSWHTEFAYSKNVFCIWISKKDTTRVPQIEKYELSGFVYIMLDEGGNSR